MKVSRKKTLHKGDYLPCWEEQDYLFPPSASTIKKVEFFGITAQKEREERSAEVRGKPKRRGKERDKLKGRRCTVSPKPNTGRVVEVWGEGGEEKMSLKKKR